MASFNEKPLPTSFCVKIKHNVHYFGDQTVLHGFRYVLSLSYVPYLKRLFWLIIITGCAAGAAGILREVLQLYSSEAVSYSVDTNYLTWDTPFPAVAICQHQLQPQKLQEYLAKNKLSSRSTSFLKDVGIWNNRYCKSCEKCQSCATCSPPATDCLQDFQPAVRALRARCSELLAECWWAGRKFSCCDRFRPMPTEWGVCFAFNSRLTGNDSVFVVNRVIGLPDLMFTASQPIFIRIHSPDDMISLAIENSLGMHAYLPLVTEFDLLLKAEQTVNDVSVKSISASGRGCLFEQEKPAQAQYWPYKRYSYNTCILYRRTVAQVERCNCTHHFMPKLEQIPICNVSGLACLHKNKDFLANVTSSELCPMSCDELQYKVVHLSYNAHKNVTAELSARGSRARVALAHLPALRVRRLAIRDTLGLVVDIGGVGGVFFGASLLSVIEIWYLLCLRKKQSSNVDF